MLAAFLIALIALVAANFEALSAWVRLWAFAGHEYGFVVAGTSAWLLWRSRGDLSGLKPAPDWCGLFLIVALALATWVAYLVDLRLLQLFLFIASAGALVWTLLGTAALRIVAWPLAFLLLALPVWNLIRPLLQALTVKATTVALQLAGMPVFVDGTAIHTPQGAFVVLSECSGAQYFQAGITIGVLYAGLSFDGWRMRALVIAVFGLAAMVGNWLRVLALVFVGDITDTQHFLVGWGLFALLAVTVFWLSQRWPEGRAAAVRPVRVDHAFSPVTLFAAAAVSASLLAAAPVAARMTAGNVFAKSEAPAPPIAVQEPWSGPQDPGADWRPEFTEPLKQELAAYSLAGNEVIAYWAYYPHQRQGREVVNESNKVYAPPWRPRGGRAGNRYIELVRGDGVRLQVVETRLENLHNGAERLVWHWYRVAGRDVARPWRAKLAQILGLAEGRRDAMVIALSADGSRPESVRRLLQSFVEANVREAG